MEKKRIRVLVIDDSALVREILATGLSQDPELEVVGKAIDVYAARDKILYLKPDVLTLDIEMPRMDGLTFLRRLMLQHPLPVVMVSSMTSTGAKITLDALNAGAVDFVLKPSSSIRQGLGAMMHELAEKIKFAACVDMRAWKKNEETAIRFPAVHVLSGTTDRVVAIGASTGGTVALTRLISEFPANMPGTVIVQHMPPVFTRLFADALNQKSRVEVAEARDGDRILSGRVLIAPGDTHMQVIRSGGQYLVRCGEGNKVNGHRPSVDVLFHSVAREVGCNALGVILTGMGRDGATGLLAMRNSGARTLAQDESSSVVFGMPREAWLCGGAERLVALDKIGSEILSLLARHENRED